MQRVFQVIAAICLIGTIAPSTAYLFGGCTLSQAQLLTLLATLGWFVHAPLAARAAGAA